MRYVAFLGGKKLREVSLKLSKLVCYKFGEKEVKNSQHIPRERSILFIFIFHEG